MIKDYPVEGKTTKMNIDKVEKAIIEAERFLESANILKMKSIVDRFTFFGCKETGDLRRLYWNQSMDLTRALAELRAAK